MGEPIAAGGDGAPPSRPLPEAAEPSPETSARSARSLFDPVIPPASLEVDPDEFAGRVTGTRSWRPAETPVAAPDAHAQPAVHPGVHPADDLRDDRPTIAMTLPGRPGAVPPPPPASAQPSAGASGARPDPSLLAEPPAARTVDLGAAEVEEVGAGPIGVNDRELTVRPVVDGVAAVVPDEGRVSENPVVRPDAEASAPQTPTIWPPSPTSGAAFSPLAHSLHLPGVAERASFGAGSSGSTAGRSENGHAGHPSAPAQLAAPPAPGSLPDQASLPYQDPPLYPGSPPYQSAPPYPAGNPHPGRNRHTDPHGPADGRRSGAIGHQQPSGHQPPSGYRPPSDSQPPNGYQQPNGYRHSNGLPAAAGGAFAPTSGAAAPAAAPAGAAAGFPPMAPGGVQGGDVGGVPGQGGPYAPLGPGPGGAIGWPPPPRSYPPGIPRRRRVWPLVAVAIVVLLVLVGGGVALLARTVSSSPAGAPSVAPSGSSSGSAGAGTPAVARSADARAAGGSVADERTTGVNGVLAVMSRAVRSHDQAAYLSVFDPKNSSLVTHQRAVFAGMIALPMDAPEFSWTSGDAEAPARAAGYPSGALVAGVDFRYALRGWDPATIDDGLALTFAPVGGRWLVVSDSEPLAGLDAGRFTEPWQVGQLIAVERPHVLVVGEKAHQLAVARLAGRLEGLVSDVRRIWPEPSWNGKVVAYAMTDKRFVAHWFGSQAADGRQDDPRGQASFVAKVTVLSSSQLGSPWQAAAPRLIITPYLLGQSDDYSLALLRHEVTHVATVLVGRAGPAWIREGVAEYTGFKVGRPRVSAARTLVVHGLPPATYRAMRHGSWRPKLVNEPAVFYNSDATAVDAAYVDAWMACLYVADRYGDATLRRLYDVAAAQPDSATMNEVDAVALSTVLNTDHASFTSAVRAYGIRLARSVH